MSVARPARHSGTERNTSHLQPALCKLPHSPPRGNINRVPLIYWGRFIPLPILNLHTLYSSEWWSVKSSHQRKLRRGSEKKKKNNAILLTGTGDYRHGRPHRAMLGKHQLHPEAYGKGGRQNDHNIYSRFHGKRSGEGGRQANSSGLATLGNFSGLWGLACQLVLGWLRQQNIVSSAVWAPVESYGSAFVSTSKAYSWLGPLLCKNWLALSPTNQEVIFNMSKCYDIYVENF